MISLKELSEEYLESLKNLRFIFRRESKIKINNDIFALIGPRRVGKTTLMLLEASKLKKQVLFLNFEEPELKFLKVREFAKLVKKECPKGKTILFLDEVQEWINWDFNLRFLHDMKDFNLIISGSSSSLLSMEIPSKLRGRYISYQMFPLSFREIVNSLIKKIEGFRNKGKILNLFDKYLKLGGFPEVFIFESREKLLSILETIFYKDVVERFKIRDLKIFEYFFYFVINNSSSFFTYNSFKRLLNSEGVNLDTKTIINYLNYMEKAFFIFLVEKYSFSIKETIKSQKKLYLIDHSFLKFSNNPLKEGKLIENLVFIELKRRISYNSLNLNIAYYKTKNNKEIDFILYDNQNKVKELIEVAYEFDEEHKKKLMKAMDELKLKESICITWDEEDEVGEKGKKIKLIPLWKWLLS